MGLLETMKQVAQATNDAGMPTAFLFGSVTKTSPLTIRVDNRFDISGDAIVVMKEFQAGFYPTHYHTDAKSEYYYGLAVGDKVVLLRNAGGQAFLVLGRV